MPTDKYAVKWTFHPETQVGVPLVYGGRVYLQTWPPMAPTYCALNAESGVVDWEIFSIVGSIRERIVIDQGVGYCAAALNPNSPGAIIAVDPANGQQLWSVATPSYVRWLRPLDGVLYYSVAKTLYALRLSDRQPLWSYSPDGFPIDVAVRDDIILSGITHGTMFALDRHDGHLIWKLQAGAGIEDGPLLAPDGVLFRTATPWSLWKATIPTGELLWQAPVTALPFARMLLQNDLVFYFDRDRAYAARVADGHQKWTHTLPSDSIRSAALCDGMLLVAVNTTSDVTTPILLIALDAITGTERSRMQVDAGFIGSVVDGVVYAAGAEGGVRAIDIHLAWSFKTAAPLLAPAASAGTAVFFGSGDSRLYAADLTSGAELWAYDAGARIESTPAFAASSVYAAGRDRFVHALDATSGHLQWRADVGAAVLSGPAVANGIVCVSASDGRIHALKSAGGAPQWTYDAGSDAALAPAKGGVIFASTTGGAVIAIRCTDGAPLWRQEALVRFDAAPSAGTSLLFSGGSDGILHTFDLSSGVPQWKFDSGAPILAAPLAWDKAVYVVNSNGVVYGLDEKSGATLWRFSVPAGAAVNSTPAATGLSAICVGSDDGWAYILDRTTGALLWRYKTGGVVRGCAAFSGLVLLSSADGYLYAVR